MWDDDWLALIVLGGLCVLSLLWTALAAPGFRVRGLHVLLTGASDGLGLTIACKYARAGAKVSLIGDSVDKLERARQAVAKAGGVDLDSVFVAEADAADEAQMQRAVAAANDFHGRVTDHLVHAASTATPGFFWEQDLSLLRRHVDVNYMGAVVLIKTALPAMIENNIHGRVVLVSDVESLATPFASSGYSGSKCALRGLADSLRNELVLYQISVSVFYPGAFTFHQHNKDVSNAPPSTPVPGQPSTGYSTFENANPIALAKQYEREAQTLVNGLWAGQYSITSTWSGFFLRVLANGVAPRNNSPLELLLIFFTSLWQLAANFFNERSIKKASRPPTDGASV